MKSRIIRIFLTLFAGVCAVEAQTTQGLISGRILNSVTGRAVAGASVSYTSTALSASGTLRSDIAGYYFLPLLSAGAYTIRVAGDNYQPQELEELELPVAGRVQLDFRLRPLSDVWESGQYKSVFLPGTKTIVTIYGPDVDPGKSGTFEAIKGQRGALDTSQSYVIDPNEIGDLPLLGRDVFAMLVSLPTVAADSGAGRGLGVSVAGQRPSSSNYLLDGVENDNYLVTGPLLPVAPEAVQEYRISTNNYSAEYGRTAGFIANAVTRAGSAAYHGIAYEYLKNDVLNAADFQDNVNGLGKRSEKEHEFGYQAGGPVIPTATLRNRLSFSSSLDQLITHSKKDPQTYLLPTPNLLSLAAPSSVAHQLLSQYAPPLANSIGASPYFYSLYTVAQPVVVDRLIALERGDYATKSGRDRLMARLVASRTGEPDFIWTPYKAFVSGLNEITTGIAGNWQHTWTPRVTSELKFSYTDDNLWWDRSHPEVPTLVTNRINIYPVPVFAPLTLPGSPAFYAYRNHNKTPEVIYSGVWTRNRHVLTAGLGLLFRYNSGYLTAGRDSEYAFSDGLAFAEDEPALLYTTLNRLSPTPTQPNYNRNYRYNQIYFFVQDSFRLSPRLTLNFGIRYENFGAPTNTGSAKDATVMLGPGSNFTNELAGASLNVPGAGNQQLYGVDNQDWAPRFGFSWDPFEKSRTLFRGGFGIFYDRTFDNLWQNVRNNGGLLTEFSINATNSPRPTGTNYLQPVTSVIQAATNEGSSFPDLTLIDPKLKNGYTQTSFLGIQQQVTDSLTVEVNGTSALGRDLVSTDLVNRAFTTGSGLGRPNDNFPDISWRSSQGLSDYYALSTLVRYRTRTLLIQGAYTWSHSIDNQSDPLIGDFFNLDFAAITAASGNSAVSLYARQYDSHADRGNSLFDQRHNLFVFGTWQPVVRWRLARDWRFSWLAAFRTGTPYTVTADIGVPTSGGEFEVQRADILNASAIRYTNPLPGPGGVYLLNVAGFGQPGDNVLGNSGRDAFTGPGLYDIDASVARSFSIPKAREGTILTVRADFFNALNHANLGNPDSFIGDSTFGLATYGRQGTASGFPAVSPLNETARQIQILLRVEF